MHNGPARSNAKNGSRFEPSADLCSGTTPWIGFRDRASIGKDRSKFVSPEPYRGAEPVWVVSAAKSGMGFAVITARNDSRSAAVPVNEETAE